ncbi:amino acid ABC transporter permease [Methylobacterium sp. WL30]|uniref:amino acid ABC transporter permease n=1 Tax=unclassified Methylobacterium TaxID=2615210 RepID=UPI0011C90B71|nr:MULTISPECIES: amino acid ABC transporter permease [unclassified Methylobacterium]TXN39169.1 amino acid ABC transporter permease [Methylobacterium sp. WL93]TXN52015.1 amino acid ABC transporter permease [Methylobacterium sp. WL119]TXN68090.1 amino acid ABC transporter permease [Methylobacterium sp. WL30]
MRPPQTASDLPVLLPFRVSRTRARFAVGPVRAGLLGAGLAGLILVAPAFAQGPDAVLSPFQVVLRWAPLLLTGFALNVAISLIAMLLGTAAGVGLGLGLLSEGPILRRIAWALTQFFRNVPWLVLLFFVMFLVPFQVTVLGVRVPLPDWIKATVGFALPVMANVAEIVRAAVRSVPAAQWEAAESLAFTRRQTLFRIILPQCLKRMLPPWMNVYALIAMATVQASIVGVTEMLTLTAQVHAAEGGRPELFAPLYGFALLCFFLYCYPIDRLTARLERRFETA